MNKIANLCINNDILYQSFYLSKIGGDVITCDLRMKKTNNDDYSDQAVLHTSKHLYATFIHNKQQDKTKGITATDFSCFQEVKA
ncbi:MAG: S-ribosylhomocysteine lyase [Erysipelotrichaceae bacterium]|nr:S-ribosylhomocysteine lyase [Erysipelotrichaceae bacterium]